MEAVDLLSTASRARWIAEVSAVVVDGAQVDRAPSPWSGVRPTAQQGVDRPLTILVVADNSFTRAGAAAVLEDDDRLELLGTAADGREAIESIAGRRPDLVAVQLAILADDDRGVELVTGVGVDPEVRLVLFDGARSPRGDGRITVEALRSADSYLSTDAPFEVICRELVKVGRGESSPGKATLEQAIALAGALPVLSDTHRPVLELAAAGFKDAEIAEKLGHSIPTIKKRLSEVRQILGAANTPGAVGLAMHLGLIEFVGDQFEGCGAR